jgi:hypothetical protein
MRAPRCRRRSVPESTRATSIPGISRRDNQHPDLDRRTGKRGWGRAHDPASSSVVPRRPHRDDWEEGSSIVHTGTWQGKSYRDKGDEPERVLVHMHWSYMSGLPDSAEHYQQVTWTVEGNDATSEVEVAETNLPSDEATAMSEQTWPTVLSISGGSSKRARPPRAIAPTGRVFFRLTGRICEPRGSVFRLHRVALVVGRRPTADARKRPSGDVKTRAGTPIPAGCAEGNPESSGADVAPPCS